MKIGLVGYPGAGKSTVFGALTGLAVETGYAAADKANLGVVKVPDSRVDALSDLYSTKKKTYAEITFSDLGGGRGDGIDRAVLNQMRPLDALCQVLRGYPDAAGEAPDPVAEIEGLATETILADLEVAEGRVARLQKDRSNPRELELLERIVEALESEKAVRDVGLTAEEERMVAGFTFLSQKPLLLVLNVPEDEVANEPDPAIVAAAEKAGLGLIVLSAAVEMDIGQMPEEEQGEFLESMGLSEPASNRFVRAAFEMVDLISMLTAGEDECRAWPIARGTPAPGAAGKIHSDIERGFIRVEVVPWQDLIELGSEAKCRDAGKLRVEGKGYVVQDGDVCNSASTCERACHRRKRPMSSARRFPEPDEFREQLRRLAERAPFAFPPEDVPQHFGRAAWLIPFWAAGDDVHVALIRRSHAMRVQPGVVVYAGGMVDPGESFTEAALREGHEEMGLDPAAVEFAGRLDDAWSGFGHHIAPVVAWLAQPPALRANPAEVDEILIAPVSIVSRSDAREEEPLTVGDFTYTNITLRWPGGQVDRLAADLLLEAIEWARGGSPSPGAARLQSMLDQHEVLAAMHAEREAAGES